jgi:hypothetical protein
MLTLAALVSRRIVVAPASCTGAVRAALSAIDKPIAFAELRARLCDQWPRHQISSAIAKLVDAGEVEIHPPLMANRQRGQRYAPTQLAHSRRESRVQPRDSGQPLPGAQAHAPRRAGYWDGLVPALATCDA